MNDPRRWLGLHWLTWAALVLVSAAPTHYWTAARGETLSPYDTYYGWPLTHYVGYSYQPVGLAANAITWMAIIASTALVCEKLVRFRGKRRQFRLATMFALLTAAAVILAVVRIDSERFASARSLMVGLGPWRAPLHARVGLWFGIACTIYTAGWLVIRGAVRGWNVVGGFLHSARQ